MKKRYSALSLILFSTAFLLTVSCTREWLLEEHGNSANIGVYISSIANPSTKSAAAGYRLFDSFVVDTIGEQELKIDAYISDFIPGGCSAETKGSITSTGNITSFWMNAYADDSWYDNTKPAGTPGSKTDPNSAGLYFTENVSRPSVSSSSWSIADNPKWINDTDMSFWSWAGVTSLPSSSVNSDHDEMSFSFTNDGEKDIILAYNKEKRTFNDKGEITSGSGTYNLSYKDAVDIKFHHALSVVNFDVSDLMEKNIKLKSITFKGVTSAAGCKVSSDSDGNLLFAWSATATGNISRTGISASDFTATGVDGSTANALMPLTSSKLIFLIPQAVKDKGITISISYTIGSSTDTKTSEVSLNHDTAWVAGKYYTYKLSMKAVSLKVTDSVSATIKNNVSIKNDGFASTFVRASIVAYWVDASGNYLSNCDYKTQGTLVGLAPLGGKWSEESDGFFYYSDEVEPNEDIGSSLLTSYAPAAAPMSGATLRMVITAQAIKYDSAKTCYEAFND